MRVGELAHLLIEDVDFSQGLIHIRSKPELFWRVKTSRRRVLPLTEDIKGLFERLIGTRKAGFVFLNEQFFCGTQKRSERFASAKSFRDHLVGIAETVCGENADASERDKRKAVVAFCRAMGQIPEKTGSE